MVRKNSDDGIVSLLLHLALGPRTKGATGVRLVHGRVPENLRTAFIKRWPGGWARWPAIASLLAFFRKALIPEGGDRRHVLMRSSP